MAITEGKWRAAKVGQLDGGTALAVFATSSDGVSQYVPATMEDAKLMAAAPELARALRELYDLASVLDASGYYEESGATFARAAELLWRLGF